MKHFGDITKINGYELPIVDCITGGSPCQDLSVAGKRAGLDGERSGLFMEQIRITKEMREHDRKANGHMGIYVKPRFFVWENVPGALSSNNGDDFRIVLEEICKIADNNANVPRPPSGESWSNAGCILGDGWSVAWRIRASPNEGKESRLSQILEQKPHPKYFLSEKACQGILNRAERRGKTLPEQLRQALLEQISRSKLGGAQNLTQTDGEQGKAP